MSERQTRITKLKLEDGKISISYQKPSTRDPEAWLDFKLTSEEAPLPAFLDSLKRIKPEMIQILELPTGSNYGENLEITGLSIKYRPKDGALCASITAKKLLRRSAAILEIKSPSLPETATESGDDGKALSTAAALAVNEVVEQCLAYLRGERAQGQLLADQATATKDESPG